MIYVAKTSTERGRMLIEFPDCPGCQTFAERRDDPVIVARDALEGWLELHLEDGDFPPHPRFRWAAGGKRLRVRISPSIAIRLEIRWARQRLGLSQAQLAERVGVTRQQISLLESKGGNLQVSTLQKIADALDLELSIGFFPRTEAA